MSHSSRETNRSLFVRFITDEMRPIDLRNIFSQYGEVKDVYIPRDFYTGRPRGFAYVEFESIREADNAIRDSGHIKFLGRNLDVEFAQGDRKTPHEMKGRGNGRDSKDQSSHGPDRRRWSRPTERNRSRSRSITRGSFNYSRKRSRSTSPWRNRHRARSSSPNASRSRTSVNYRADDRSYDRDRFRRNNNARYDEYERCF